MATTDPSASAPAPGQPPPPPAERRNAGPLIWILVLLLLLVFGWFVYEQRSGTAEPDAPPPAIIDPGDVQTEAAARERAADDARRGVRVGSADTPRRPPAPARAPARAGPDREPVPLQRVEPAYPLAAYRNRDEGTVLVAVTVDPQGRPRDARVLRRSGSRELDDAALDAVARWTFEPAIRDGRPATAEVQVPVTFRIDR